jgi:hypothetical protein
MKGYIKLVTEAGEKINQIRDDELRKSAHPAVAILALNGSFKYAIKNQVPNQTS